MLEPSPTVVLTAVVAALAADADSIPPPDLLVDGWASLAAVEYQEAVARLAVGLLRLRAVLHESAALLQVPG